MGVPRIDTGPFTVEEFFAFTDARPDNEKWELIDGVPILNASPLEPHQFILFNLMYLLGAAEQRQPQRSWKGMPGIGVRVSDTSLPEPDVLIRPRTAFRRDRRECDDIVVAFEILSPSTAARDLKWKRTAYAGMPSLTHYVVIAQDAVDVAVFARDSGFAERRLRSLTDVLEFPALGITMPLSDIYRDTE